MELRYRSFITSHSAEHSHESPTVSAATSTRLLCGADESARLGVDLQCILTLYISSSGCNDSHFEQINYLEYSFLSR
jgi:hypothetical protein